MFLQTTKFTIGPFPFKLYYIFRPIYTLLEEPILVIHHFFLLSLPSIPKEALKDANFPFTCHSFPHFLFSFFSLPFLFLPPTPFIFPHTHAIHCCRSSIVFNINAPKAIPSNQQHHPYGLSLSLSPYHQSPPPSTTDNHHH